jgi:hypothetical protein
MQTATRLGIHSHTHALYSIIVDEQNALNNHLHHVYPINKFDPAHSLCNIDCFHTRLSNFTTDYRHYRQKEVQQPVVHQFSSEQLTAISRMRLTAQSLQQQVSEEMENIDPQHNNRTQLIRL